MAVYDKFAKLFQIEYEKISLNIACLGLRNLPKELVNPRIEFDIRSYGFQQRFESKETKFAETEFKRVIQKIDLKFIKVK